MMHSRRHFLGVTASLLASAWGAASLRAQSQPRPPSAQPPIDRFPNEPLDRSPLPEPRLSAAQRMKMNQEKIAKDMDRLKKAVSELQKEFDANNTTAVFSIAAVRKTEEIEKLAREIKGLIRG
jgi:hypothetical protein